MGSFIFERIYEVLLIFFYYLFWSSVYENK